MATQDKEEAAAAAAQMADLVARFREECLAALGAAAAQLAVAEQRMAEHEAEAVAVRGAMREAVARSEHDMAQMTEALTGLCRSLAEEP